MDSVSFILAPTSITMKIVFITTPGLGGIWRRVGEQWDLSKVHKNTKIPCRRKVKQKQNAKYKQHRAACRKGYFSLSQSLRLAFNGSQNSKTRRGGESKTLWSKWPPSGGLL